MSRSNINIVVTPEFKLELQNLAHDYRMPFSDFIREILKRGAEERSMNSIYRHDPKTE